MKVLDNIDLDILKFMSERENNKSYRATITKGLCTKESWVLVGDMTRYFEQNPQVTAVDDDFKLWFRVTGHPGWKPEEHLIYGTIIDNMLTRAPPNRQAFLSQLERIRYVSAVTVEHDALRAGDTAPIDFGTKVARVR